MKNLKYLFIVFLGVLLMSCKRTEKTNPIRKNIDGAVFGSGYIEQDNEYVVSALTNGLIDSISVKEGDRVRANDLIAILKSDVQNSQLHDAQTIYRDAERNVSLNSPQLLQLQAQIIQAKEQLNLDKINYTRYKELRNKNSVSQLDFDKAELQYITSQENLKVFEKRYSETKDALQLSADRSRIQVNTQLAVLKDYRIQADMAGQVINLYKKRGELVRSGEAIAKIGSGSYRIKLYVSEDDITKVELNQRVDVHLNTYPDKVFIASVSKILPGFNDSEQSYEVEATFDQLPPKMFAGTQLQANIEIEKRKNVLVIPASYLLKGKYVTMADGSQKKVSIGSRNSEWVEIVSGITDNDVIIKK